MTDSKPSGVRVKALVWTSHKFSVIGKGCFGAVFTISQRDNGFHVSTDSGLGVTLKTLDGAKRFYEDEYQQFVSQALEPAQPDPLGAAWMREQAAGLRDNIADQIGARPMSSIHSALCEYANAIRAIPDPTHADLLAQALKMPEVAALVDAAQDVLRHERSNFFGPNAIANSRMSYKGVTKAIRKALAALVQP